MPDDTPKDAATEMISDDLVAFADHLADTARDLALRCFRQQLEVEYKSDDTPVTTVDREIEQALRQQVADAYPAHSFIGEEFGPQDTESPWSWVVDPIDGTKSFITGKPTFGSLIALLHERTPVLGVIEIPALKERWVGNADRGTTCNHTTCRTSDTTMLADATLYATTPDMFSASEQKRFDHLSQATCFRVFGADCYAYGLLAAGHVDLVAEADMAPHDFLALVPVVEGAGGIITNWHGNPLDLHSSGQVLAAANTVLHEQALARLDPTSVL